MRKHYLESVFSPATVAVICQGEYLPIGSQVLNNLGSYGYPGKVYLVAPDCEALAGHRSLGCLGDIAEPIDLAIVAACAEKQPSIMRQCGAAQAKSVIILSGGFSETQEQGLALQNELVSIARNHGIALVGPRSLGIIRPRTRLNASSARSPVAEGKVALVTQSGAFCSAILDWADGAGFGFSAVASLGATSDVKMGDVLDYLAQDPYTHSILLYVERITNARLFLSGLRAAARLKPVVVIKSGCNESGARAALTHIRTPLGSDAVFDAAIRRAGAVRAATVNQLFIAATTLASGARTTGSRLGVITNGGAPGVMAADRAGSVGVALASLSEATLERLSTVLPEYWCHAHPVDILGNAGPQRYQAATEALLAEEGVDGVLVLLTPQGFTEATACAEAVVAAAAGTRKPVMASWMGSTLVEQGRDALAHAGIPHFTSPEAGVDAFHYLARYRRNQNVLLQVPEPLSAHRDPDTDRARSIVDQALAQQRQWLDAEETEALLTAFRIPLLAGAEAMHLGEDVHLRELALCIKPDPVFGPVIHFGPAGAAVEAVAGQMQVALPPLNDFLARELVARSTVKRYLGRYRDLPEADLAALSVVLQRVSEVACELPAVVELEIKPLLACETGVVAGAARIRVQQQAAATSRYAHMAIHPYPADLQGQMVLADGAQLQVRPIRPEDGRSEDKFVAGLSPQSKYFRFMHGLDRLTPAMLARFTQIDYDREMALVAIPAEAEQGDTFVGVVRYVTSPDANACEFALAVADEWQSRGLGPLLMRRLIHIARQRGLETMFGEVLAQNPRMLRMCKRLGFHAKRSADDPEVVVVTLPL